MTRQATTETTERFALCVRNDGYPVSLDVEKVYPVLPDAQGEAHGMLRVVDETGEDYLYPIGLFRIVDSPQFVHEKLTRAS
jgi:hypothetical protein